MCLEVAGGGRPGVSACHLDGRACEEHDEVHLKGVCVWVRERPSGRGAWVRERPTERAVGDEVHLELLQPLADLQCQAGAEEGSDGG